MNKIKVVTLIIKKTSLYENQLNVLLFKTQIRSNKSLLMIPKKCIYNFEKIITYFPHWKGRKQEKAFKFDIPLWLYNKQKIDIERMGDSMILKNTHK